ncbi:MAG TPA: ABC transporter permease [Candidatus Acidoferrum sp.]|nr:ABC transporter permease [Candidatus Acidoferrum sp.]
MDWLRQFFQRLHTFLRGAQMDRELEAEMLAHLQFATEENLQRGMSPSEARRQALIQFGGTQHSKEQHREARSLPFLDSFLQDVRFGLRMLWRSPGFSLLAIFCLTLGIGASAAVYSWMEGLLFRPYPAVAHQERLLAVTGTSRGESGATGVSWPDFLDLQKNGTLFDSFFVSKIMGTTLSIGDRAERAIGSIVSANYFDALGVHPILGRTFEPGEDVGRGAHPVTVISYQLWKGRFNGDPFIVGKTQRLNGVIHSIIGVAPEGFYGTFVGWAMQFWVSASMEDTFEAGGYKLEDRGARWIEAYVRLRPGVTRDQAQQEVSAIAKRLESDYPATNRGRGIKLWPLWQTPFNNAGTLLPTLGLMLAVVTFVLLIACANVGNLLLVRSFGRRHEMSVRVAIGAARGRLLSQLLTEGLILATFAAVGGLAVAHWCRRLLVLLLPARGGITMHLPGELDWRVLSLSVAVCLGSILLFALVPAIHASKIDTAAVLKSETAAVLGGGGKSWLRASLVLVQVSLSFVLLVGAGLLMLSLQRIRSASPGFSTQNVLVTGIDLVGPGYDVKRARIFQGELINRVQALPGVESVAFARTTPLGYGTFSSAPVAVDGYVPPPDEKPAVEYNQVGPGYFSTLGIPLIAGREFTLADNETSALVAVVNETMAEKYWRGRNPIGQRVQVKDQWLQIVGIAKTSKYESVRELPQPFFYVPLRQNPAINAALNLRSRLGPEKMAAALAREVHSIDAGLAPYEVITLQEQLERSTSPQRVAVTLTGILGGLALFLAAIGLYGVMAYSVSQSTRELGLRMALGARPSELFRLVMSRGLALTAAGIVLGVLLALASARLLGYLFYQVSPRDPLVFGSAFLVLTIVSLVACFLPAWRAMRVDPIVALRYE